MVGASYSRTVPAPPGEEHGRTPNGRGGSAPGRASPGSPAGRCGPHRGVAALMHLAEEGLMDLPNLSRGVNRIEISHR